MRKYPMPNVLYRLLTTPIGRQWEEARLVSSTREVIRGMTGSWTASWLKISDTFSLIQRSVSSYRYMQKNCNESFSPWTVQSYINCTWYMKKNCNESCSPLTAEFYDCCDMYHMKFIIMRVIVLYTWTSILPVIVVTSMYCIERRVIPLGQQFSSWTVEFYINICDI